MQLKVIGRIRIQLTFANPKLKTLNNVPFKLNEEKVSDTLFISWASLFWQFWLIKLLTSNEWIWSYKAPNWTRLDPNKKYASPHQYQVVSKDDNVRTSLTRPRKRTTQLALTMKPLCKNWCAFWVFTLKGFLMGSRGANIFPLHNYFLPRISGKKTS